MNRAIGTALFISLPQLLIFGQQVPLFESEANLVPIDVQVIDRDTHQPRNGLVREDFIVLDDGEPVRLGLFDGSFIPLDLVLLIDMSGGLQNEGKLFTTDAFLRLREPEDRMALISFSDEQANRRVSLTDSQSELVDARHAVFRIDSHDASHRAKNSRLYDAILEGIRAFPEATSRSRRPVIVVITHNREARSSIKKSSVITALLDSRITLEAIVIPQEVGRHYLSPSFSAPGIPSQRNQRPYRPLFLENLHSIEEIVQAAGGLTTHFRYQNAFPTGVPDARRRGWNTDELARRLNDELMLRLRIQYTLGIYSPTVKERRYHRLEVRLTDAARQKYPNAVVHARAGYYAGVSDAKKTPK